MMRWELFMRIGQQRMHHVDPIEADNYAEAWRKVRRMFYNVHTSCMRIERC
jgi:hypothetical protein